MQNLGPKSIQMQLSTYAAKCIFSYMFLCACLQWSRRVEISSGYVSSFACNLLGLQSLQSLACFCCEVFRCFLIFLQNIAFAAEYGMNPAIRQTFTAGSTRQNMALCSIRFLSSSKLLLLSNQHFHYFRSHIKIILILFVCKVAWGYKPIKRTGENLVYAPFNTEQEKSR